MATDSVARAIALAGLANGGGGGGLSTIVAGTGTSSIIMNHDDANTNEASGNYSTALGYGTKAAGQGALAAGDSEISGNIQASGDGAIAIGKTYATATGTGVPSIVASGQGSAAIGAAVVSATNSDCTITASGHGSIAMGATASSKKIISSGIGSFACGNAINGTILAEGAGSIALGYSLLRIQASSSGSFAGGYGTSDAKGEGSFAWTTGGGAFANKEGSVCIGNGLLASGAMQQVRGKYNINDTANTYADIYGIGTGTRVNGYTLDWTGNATFAGTVTSASGADYAEYFEWKDGNVNSEDRVGYIVTLDGDKIVKAKAGDDILGIISGCATVIGDNAEWNWQGRFERDEFGRIIYEQVEQFIDTPDPDWKPNPEKPDEEVPMIKKSLGYFPVPRENADYDPTKEYSNRSNRPEWDTVGMMGKLYVRDDGTAAINDYVTVSATTDGVATKAENRTSMRVMERVNDHIIRVCFK